MGSWLVARARHGLDPVARPQGDAMSRQIGPGLYNEAFEKDACGFGLIANLDDQPSHWLVKTAIASLNRLTHRGTIAGWQDR